MSEWQRDGSSHYAPDNVHKFNDIEKVGKAIQLVNCVRCCCIERSSKNGQMDWA